MIWGKVRLDGCESRGLGGVRRFLLSADFAVSIKRVLSGCAAA